LLERPFIDPDHDMTPLQNATLLAGRILLGLIFVLSGFGKIGGFAGTAAYIATQGLPLPEVVAALTVLIEVVGGLALVVGFRAREAAIVLAVFTLLAGFVFHNFWAVPEAQKMAQQINFLKNLAIAGGMLFVSVFGPGGLSVDARRAPA
jgi:putative oxidoreductase